MTLGYQVSKRSHRGAGYTLVEVLVAVALVAVMLVTLHAGFASGFSTIQNAREDLRATQIMMQQMEAIRLCSWGQLSNCPISFVEYYYPAETNINNRGAAFYGRIGVSPCDSIPDSAIYKTNICLVTITINWTNYNGARPVAHRREMQTQAALCGLHNYIWGAGS